MSLPGSLLSPQQFPMRLEVTKVVHAMNNLQVQCLLSLKPVEQWRWAHERPGVGVEFATIAANAATAAFAFDSGGWTVTSIVPMPTGSRRLPRNCFRILGPNVSRMIAIGSLMNHGMGGGPSNAAAASPSNGDMSEPGPNCRSDDSPLTGTVAHRPRHHQDCENRVHVQNQARSSPENDFPVASANIAGCLSSSFALLAGRKRGRNSFSEDSLPCVPQAGALNLIRFLNWSRVGSPYAAAPPNERCAPSQASLRCPNPLVPAVSLSSRDANRTRFISLGCNYRIASSRVPYFAV